MARILYTSSENTFFGLFCWKTKNGQKHGLTLLEKRYIFDFLNRCFLSLKWLDFFLQGHKTQSVLAYFAEKQTKTKFAIFDQKPCTNPFGKMPVFILF